MFCVLLGPETYPNGFVSKFCAESTNFQVLSSHMSLIYAEKHDFALFDFFEIHILFDFHAFLNLFGDTTCSNSSAAKFCAGYRNVQVLSSDIRPVQAQNSDLQDLG